MVVGFLIEGNPGILNIGYMTGETECIRQAKNMKKNFAKM